MPNDLCTIGGLRESGFSRRTLLFYADVGLIRPEVVLPNGYRLFRSEATLTRLRKVAEMRGRYSLEQIRERLDHETRTDGSAEPSDG